MEEDVRVKGAEEEQGGRARIVEADDAGGGGAAEVVGQDLHAPARRAVRLVGIKGNHERARAAVHVDREVRGDRVLHEGNEVLGEGAEHDARIGGRIDVRQLGHELRHFDLGRTHGLGEQGLLRFDVAEDGGGGDAELLRDVGERRGLVALGGEDAGGGGEELGAGDAGRASHR